MSPAPSGGPLWEVQFGQKALQTKRSARNNITLPCCLRSLARATGKTEPVEGEADARACASSLTGRHRPATPGRRSFFAVSAAATEPILRRCGDRKCGSLHRLSAGRGLCEIGRSLRGSNEDL